MLDFIWAIVGAVVGALIWEAAKAAVARLRENAEPHTGTWLMTIPPHGEEVQKEDVYEMRQKGQELVGTIVRRSPPSQVGRRWCFRGRLIGRDFIAAFWGDSYGVFFMRKPRSEDWRFEGRYLSIHDSLKPDGVVSGNLDAARLFLVRLPSGKSR